MLFKKAKKIDTNKWGEAYTASPRVYEKGGALLGAIAITEGTLTIIPKDPKAIFTAGGKEIKEWNLVLFSTTKDSVVASVDYYASMKRIGNYVIEENDSNYLIKELSLDDINELAN